VSAQLQESPTGAQWFQWLEGVEVCPGIWRDVPSEVYHRGPGISKSGLDLIDTSGALYWTVKQNPREATDAMFLGTVLHALVLEPDTFDQRYIAAPANAPRKPSDRERYAKKPSPETLQRVAWWDEFEQQAQGRIVVPNDDGDTIWKRDTWSTVHYMRDAIMAHPEAAIFLEPADVIAELSHYWIDPDTKRLCKCRHDAWNGPNRMIIDLKSARDATLSGFQRAVHEHRYDVQAAWYQDGTHRCGQIVESMIFIACEKQPPYHVAAYEIDPNWVREGRIKYQRNLMDYDQMLREQEWPGLPDVTRILPQPSYARYNPVS
jgi:exodeoxyribonuclease VIII